MASTDRLKKTTARMETYVAIRYEKKNTKGRYGDNEGKYSYIHPKHQAVTCITASKLTHNFLSTTSTDDIGKGL
jgi:hypothetical protein